MARILIVEDEKELADNLKLFLANHNFLAEAVYDGDEAIFRLLNYRYDLVILDLGLPDMDGVTVLEKFRANGGLTPVIILTGVRAVKDKERGLDAGADDYVTKPFDLREFIARVRALLRRPREAPEVVLKVGRLELDPKFVKVKYGDSETVLSPKEFSLVQFLMRHPDQHFTSNDLIERVWSTETEITPQAVRVQVTRLRKKLSGALGIQVISNLRGLGYFIDSSELK